jgi:hypothetical protein
MVSDVVNELFIEMTGVLSISGQGKKLYVSGQM